METGTSALRGRESRISTPADWSQGSVRELRGQLRPMGPRCTKSFVYSEVNDAYREPRTSADFGPYLFMPCTEKWGCVPNVLARFALGFGVSPMWFQSRPTMP